MFGGIAGSGSGSDKAFVIDLTDNTFTYIQRLPNTLHSFDCVEYVSNDKPVSNNFCNDLDFRIRFGEIHYQKDLNP